jgi:membrane-associated phospholipid phosphatase
MVPGMRVRGVLGEQPAFLCVALAYVGVGAVASVAGLPMRLGFYHPAMLMAVIVLFWLFLLTRVFVLITTPGPGRPTARLIRDVRAQLNVHMVLRAVPVLLLMPAVLSIYTSWKVMIPDVVPMHWDPKLAALDRTIHGDDVWRLLAPVLGSRTGGVIAGVIYAAWFWIFQIVLVWQALSSSRAREQFLVSWILIWGVLGTAGALAFASVGPIYYGRLHAGPDPFAGLYDYVHSLPEWVYRIQDGLWNAYATHELAGFGKGISAMPSLHVAVATLNALAAWRCYRWLGGVLGVYAALVAIASVDLGWHYAVDAYAGAAMAVLIWVTVGWALDRLRLAKRSRATTPVLPPEPAADAAWTAVPIEVDRPR